MRLISAIIFSIVLYTAVVPAAAQPAATRQQAPAATEPSQNNVQELRQDVQRMKVLVQQMETNLAFVDTTQSPLKHQFQLEIDMWKTVIAEMERKLDSPKRP
jgi:TolA-binding protein